MLRFHPQFSVVLSDALDVRSGRISILDHSQDNQMTDPRNVAHDKRVQQEKKHQDIEVAPGSDKTPQPGKKTHMSHHAGDDAKVPDEAAPVPSDKKPLV